MLKVLFVAAEAVPFAKSGGLGDVIGSLPKELKQQGVDARVILPNYQDIPEKYKKEMVLKSKFVVPVGWRQKYCGVLELEYQGITFYFIDNEYYFKRHGFYGYNDDAERFGFFSRAVLEALNKIDFMPDILHCHDWHTGMVSVLFDAHYRQEAEYAHLKTLFTIHNLRYQGVFPKEVLQDVLSLDWKYFNPDGVEFNNTVNFLKGGLAYSDMISTVSRTYAQEIQDPYFGEQLDGFLRKRQGDLVGIINGLDYEDYNPATDPKIFTNYDVKSLAKRTENKLALQKQLGLAVNADIPVLAIVSRLVGPKGIDLMERRLVDMLKSMEMDNHAAQLVVLGTGEARYENFFRYIAWQYPGKISASIMFDDALARQIYAGADMFLMPSLYEPCGIGQLIAMRYGCMPIVRETGGLRDTVIPFDEEEGTGNGVSFANYNAHEMSDAIDAAFAMFRNKKQWDQVITNGMKSDYSWRQSAQQYQDVYKKMMG